MTQAFSMDFRDQYKKAFDIYTMGYWEHAKKEFHKAQMILENHNQKLQQDQDTKAAAFDQLSANILEYMESLDFKAPDDWEGFKPFDE